jgi:DNA-binding transcriptional LysR family regulator
MLANLDFLTIKYAVTVAEHRSFRRAAEALNVRQSVVSRRIRRMEDLIGVSVFERHAGGLRLTNAGRMFVHDARSSISLLEKAVDRAGSEGRAEVGHLNLGFFPSLVTGCLQSTLKLFRSRSPDVIVELSEGSPVDQLHWLRGRRVDAGILAGGYDAPDLECLPLWEERIFVALPHDHRLTVAQSLNWRDLRQEPWLIRTFESSALVYNFLIGRIATDGYFPAITLHLTSRENILGLVGAGYGITIVPEPLTTMVYPDVVFRPIADSGALLPISMAWLATNDNPVLRSFISLLRQLREARRP